MSVDEPAVPASPAAAAAIVATQDTADERTGRPSAASPARPRRTRAGEAARKVASPWASLIAIVIAVLWTIPTLGLLVTSFRVQKDILTTGWWTAIVKPWFTTRNYALAMSGNRGSLVDYFINSFVITIPGVLLPLLLAALAAYAFAWIKFPGRDFLFVCLFALQVVPLQVALVPLLQMYTGMHIQGTYWTVWLSHTIFALPLAVFLLHNFMTELPYSLIEAATVDGASHVQIFFRVILPLLAPALASFGIFQFLWVWNDLLVSLVFLGSRPDVAPITVYISQLSGSRGGAWHLLSAGAFVSIFVPVLVFLGLQKYFVRGLLAGGVKG